MWQSSRGLPLLIDDGEHSYIYGPSLAPIAQIGDATGTVTYLHGDLIGSTRVITDGSGEVVGTSRYDEYGNRIQVAGPTDSAIGYSGALTDPDTGLVYLRARDYDPSTMQFLTVDPAVDSTRQPYAYVANNPLTQTDPTGLDIWQQLARTATEQLTGAGQELLAGAAGVVDSFTGGASSALLGAVVPGYDCFISQHSVAFTAGQVVGTVAQIVLAVVSVIGTGGAALGPVLAGIAGRLALKASVKAAVNATKKFVVTTAERIGARAVTKSERAASGAADDSIELFRHVGSDELADIVATGEFRASSNSLGGKWFGTTLADAQRWGATMYGEVTAVVRVRVPSSFARQLFEKSSLDGIGPARYVAQELLPEFNRLIRGTIEVFK